MWDFAYEMNTLCLGDEKVLEEKICTFN